jgi:hypothetical protein
MFLCDSYDIFNELLFYETVSSSHDPRSMRKLKELIREAQTLAELKGHVLGKFSLLENIDFVSPSGMGALCLNCGAFVGIDPSPPTGLSVVWGTATTKPCRKQRKKSF